MPAKDSDDSTDQLIKQIDSYLHDKHRRYAIALEGAWGSGKTRFLEKKVAPHLKNENIDLVRISMFGVSSADDLYERIAMALIHLSGRSKKAQSAIGTIGSNLGRLAREIVARAGFPLNISVSMQSVVCLMLQKKHFLVFDDVERRSKEGDDLALFGAANDLVEGMGAKVLFVTNTLSSDEADSTREFDRNVREKLVWKIYRFKPSPTTLAKDILTVGNRPVDDVDVSDAIIAGAEASECVNARAMIRAEHLVHKLCDLEALRDKAVAPQNRFDALRDVVNFALLTCMGEAPSRPERETSAAWPSPEALEYERNVELYGRYTDFPEIDKAFDPSGHLAKDALEQGFRSYIDRRYPNNADTLEIMKIADKLRYVYSLDDEEVDPLAKRFYEVAPKADFSIACLRDALAVYFSLSDLGYDCPFTLSEFAEFCKRAVAVNPENALERLSGPEFLLDERQENRALVSELQQCAQKQLRERASKLLPVSMEHELTGKDLASRLEEAAKWDVLALLEADPKLIVATFCGGRAEDQERLRTFFVHLGRTSLGTGKASAAIAEWVSEIKHELEESRVMTRTGNMRKRWFLDNLGELSSRLADRETAS